MSCEIENFCRGSGGIGVGGIDSAAILAKMALYLRDLRGRRGDEKEDKSSGTCQSVVTWLMTHSLTALSHTIVENSSKPKACISIMEVGLY